MLLLLVVAVLRIPAASCGNQTVFTDLSGSVLVLNEQVLSTAPGCGNTVLFSENNLFWKECPQGSPQRIVSLDAGEIFSREYFSGPFYSDYGILVCVPGKILLLDLRGTVKRSLQTGEYPGSLCGNTEYIWFVSSEDGVLKRIRVADEVVETVDLSFVPVTVEYRNGLLLIGKSQGGYSLMNLGGNTVFDIQQGFWGHFSGDSAVTYVRSTSSEGCETLMWETVSVDIKNGEETVTLSGNYACAVSTSSAKDNPEAHFDVPYMHQKWDTPDWFNGNWSCGPTSCMMAVQYYNRLTPDSIWCSSPTGHWSQWGNYLPTEYTFLGHTYDTLGESPGGVWVPGSHGFIYISYDEGGAGWNEMVSWMQQHGLDSFWLGTTWSACTSELDNSWVVVASTTSPYTGGHILVFNGYYSNHSVICNDSYGNQNEPGWGTLPNGKDVVYDWPGYNNGNTQLGISQLFSARSEVLTPAGTLIDDRTLGYRKLGPCQYWHEQQTGYNGYSWWTYSTGALPDTCRVEWIPVLSYNADYEVETYIPDSHATATGIYHINTTSGWQTAVVNQGDYSNQWVSLGTFNLSPASAMVKMGDYTGTQGQYISFDAIRFTEQTSIEDQSSSSSEEYFTISQNPVQAGSSIVFDVPEGCDGTLSVYDMNGRLAASATSTIPGILPAGVYHAVISSGIKDIYQTISFTVVD
ncbi:MAG: C39 family peptidase [Candidatus Fermentibacteraceae bacterium]|nr:C39 family peptidase [Candidatus Fermentibacteraceae bacterium]